MFQSRGPPSCSFPGCSSPGPLSTAPRMFQSRGLGLHLALWPPSVRSPPDAPVQGAVILLLGHATPRMFQSRAVVSHHVVLSPSVRSPPVAPVQGAVLLAFAGQRQEPMTGTQGHRDTKQVEAGACVVDSLFLSTPKSKRVVFLHSCLSVLLLRGADSLFFATPKSKNVVLMHSCHATCYLTLVLRTPWFSRRPRVSVLS